MLARVAFFLALAFVAATAGRAMWAALPDCPAEDSANCKWNASTRGNRGGQSFFDIAGYAFDVDAN